MALPLFAELTRRRVFRALVGYGIAAFAVLQIIEPVMHGLHWPEATLSYVVVALAIGFPIVVALAWIFDVREGRIERAAPSGPRGISMALLIVGLGAAAAAPGLAYFFLWRRAPAPIAAAQAAPSIAVLPFADMSPEKDQEYFSDGIAEEILNALAQVDGLRVAGRTSSFSFKGKNEDLSSIAEKLHVATLLEGSVRKSGNRVRITAQLINARDGFHLWSKQYDRELSDIFAVQGELSAAVVEALKVKLLPTAAPALKIARARDPEAYRLFLVGRSHEARVTEVVQAEAAYKKAIALDPAYARAWASLAEMHGFLVLTAPRHEQSRRSREALDEAERTVALDPELPEAYSTRGWIRGTLFWDWPGAKSDLARAVQLSPGSKDALNNYALYVQKTGRLEEAIALQRKVTEVDPLDVFGWTNLGVMLMQDGQLGAAREAFLRSQEISPDNGQAASSLPLIDLLESHPAKALQAIEKLPNEIFRLAGIAIAHHDLGHARESKQALDALLARAGGDEPDVAFRIAAVYAWRGERDRAFEWLDRAFERRDLAMRNLRIDPYFRSLRDDPRFPALLKKLNLPLD